MLDNNTLIHILNNYEADARNALTKRITDDNEITRRYEGQPYGSEIEDRSQVVSEDVKDTVESDMPALIRTLVNSGPICKFTANDPENEADVKEAEEKTEFADWLIRGQVGSYKINYDFIKTVDMYKCAALKYVIDEDERVVKEEFKAPQGGEIELLEKITSTPFYDSHDVISIKPVDDGFLYKVEIKTKRQEIKILPVPNETFLISSDAQSIEDAELVGDISTKTRGELLAEGYKRELVDKLPQSKGNTEGETTRSLRYGKNESASTNSNEWALQKVEIIDLVALVDYHQNGMLERRHIIKSGDFILENEPFDHVNYTLASAIGTPYSAIGEGRAKQVLNVARVKTELERGLIDNTLLNNNPETHINDNVNQDDQYSNEIGKVVRHKGQTPVANNVSPYTVPYVGDKALIAIQYQDQKKSKIVGNQLTSQGLNADEINNETATRFKGVEKAEAAKLELTVRNIAEIGYKKLYSGVVWMAQRYMDREVVINKMGDSVKIDPSKWQFDHDTSVQVGLGTGNSQETVENLTGLWQIHTQLKAEQSPLTDEVKRYNVLSDLTKALELTDVSRYFNNPEKPNELLQAENEQLNAAMMQAQEQMALLQQAADNPLAEAEMVKREGELAIAQGKLQLEVAKLQEQQRQFDVKTNQDDSQHEDDVALQVTKLELDNQTDLPGGVQ